MEEKTLVIMWGEKQEEIHGQRGDRKPSKGQADPKIRKLEPSSEWGIESISKVPSAPDSAKLEMILAHTSGSCCKKDCNYYRGKVLATE